jgi:general secretion pathway protein A
MSRVYLDYFGLEQTPCAITPDPAFVFLSPRHQDALAHLLYGVGQGGGGGFVQLTGEVGTGKTTLCRCLLEQTPENSRIALILNPALTPAELVAAICEELSVDTFMCDGSLKQLVDRLNVFLLDSHARGERVVVVVDEAQNLSRDALEQVRLLTNLETDKDKLLQIVLLGQPELRDLLGQDNLRQLAQRITARYHLTPLNQAETISYVRHRLAVAGSKHSPFSLRSLKTLYKRSTGVPRLINIVADRALVAAYAGDKQQINAAMINTAADEVQGEFGKQPMSRWSWAVVALLVAVVVWGLAGQNSLQPKQQIIRLPPVEQPVAEQVADQVAEQTVDRDPMAAESPVTVPVLVPELIPELPLLDRELIQQLDDVTWSSMAFRWGRNDTDAALKELCLEGQASPFTCLRIQGSWSKIRQLGLPVILEIPAETTRFLLLAGLGDDHASLALGEQDILVDINQLDSRWLGTFLVVWPQAADWPQELALGNQGEAVSRLKIMASRLEFPYVEEDSELFTQTFSTWIQSFQRRFGLLDDGIIGPETLIYLMAPGIEQPRLSELSNMAEFAAEP